MIFSMKIITLYRPVGQIELDLIKASGNREFPPRLSWQPIFYPVLDYEYACTIARDWNTNDDANGNVGYVTRFDIPVDYFQRFEVQNVGGINHNEIWVPAEELAEFNRAIIDGIHVVTAFFGENFKGEQEVY